VKVVLRALAVAASVTQVVRQFTRQCRQGRLVRYGFLTKRLTNRYMQIEAQGLKARCEGRKPDVGPT
jgi:hypothetical protein